MTERAAKYGPLPRDPVARFWSFVSKGDGCWEWTGATSRGYGTLRVGSSATGTRRKILAHRYSLELALGREPTGMVLHHCDNRRCVRPDHLYEGTSEDNMRDAYDRRRIIPYDRRGSRNSNFKHGRYAKAGSVANSD